MFVCGTYVVTAYRWFHERRPKSAGIELKIARRIITSSAFTVLWYIVHVLIVIPIIITLCLGPFFGPSVALRPAQTVRFLSVSICYIMNHWT
jgi:hypothetical protein